MSSATNWLRCDKERHEHYFRDTHGGRQYLTYTEDKEWQFTQEGYVGVLLTSSEQNEVIKFADSLTEIESLRVGSLDAYEFAKSVYNQIGSILKHMLTGDPMQAEEGLKEVARIEAYMYILRSRLVDRTAVDSWATKSETRSAELLRNVNDFYSQLLFGYAETAGRKLDNIREHLEEMQTELVESGGTGSRS